MIESILNQIKAGNPTRNLNEEDLFRALLVVFISARRAQEMIIPLRILIVHKALRFTFKEALRYLRHTYNVRQCTFNF